MIIFANSKMVVVGSVAAKKIGKSDRQCKEKKREREIKEIGSYTYNNTTNFSTQNSRLG